MKLIFFRKKWANPGLFLFIFRSFLVTISIIQIEKRVDGVLGIRTRGRRMVDADETTELWRPPEVDLYLVQLLNKNHKIINLCAAIYEIGATSLVGPTLVGIDKP